MCGRYTITIDERSLEERFGARFVSGHFEPNYNAAPSQQLPIITTYAPDVITLATWGFLPEDCKNSRMRPQNNARLETAAEKPMFQKSFDGQHCLVLADSFYEWKTVGTRKQPYRIMLKSGEPFAMAGIYARDHNDHSHFNFAILTTAANEIMRPIHDRMPVLIPRGGEKHWLPTGGFTIFNEYPSDQLMAYPVTPKMNRASFNGPEAIAPLERVIA